MDIWSAQSPTFPLESWPVFSCVEDWSLMMPSSARVCFGESGRNRVGQGVQNKAQGIDFTSGLPRDSTSQAKTKNNRASDQHRLDKGKADAIGSQPVVSNDLNLAAAQGARHSKRPPAA